MTSEPTWRPPSCDDDAESVELEMETPPNWPGAAVMIAFFVTVIVICGLCTWGTVELMGGR